MLKTLRTSPDGCLSDYRRDKLVAKELPPDEEQAARAHLATCARCAERVREATADAARFATAAPPWEAIAAAAPKPRRRPRLVSYGLLAAAASVALVATLTRGPGKDPQTDTRTKGSERLGFFVKRGETTWAGKPGEALRPGDAVQFTYSAPGSSFLAIVSVSLFVLNLLPIPILDGGQIVYQLAELAKGSPLSERTQAVGQQIGIVLLLVLMSFAFYNDLSRLFS